MPNLESPTSPYWPPLPLYSASQSVIMCCQFDLFFIFTLNCRSSNPHRFMLGFVLVASLILLPSSLLSLLLPGQSSQNQSLPISQPTAQGPSKSSLQEALPSFATSRLYFSNIQTAYSTTPPTTNFHTLCYFLPCFLQAAPST